MLNEQIAREVLQKYTAAPWPLLKLCEKPGFSGAVIWRVLDFGGEKCLRAWPANGPSPAVLRQIHFLMRRARAAGLAFVPTLHETNHEPAWVEAAGRLWDLTTWMPGRADFQTNPSRERLAAACTAIGKLHSLWERADPGLSVCPGIRRRLARLRAWENLVGSGWRPSFGSDLDPVRPWAEKAWRLVQQFRCRVPGLLAPWLERRFPTQECLCDVWHDHVLFQGDQVSGLVDYGSIKTDHVAVDLARLLGSLVGDDRQMQAVGIESYRRVHALSDDEEQLVKVLDETGTVLGAANWLRWLYHEGRTYVNRDAVARRLASLVQRMENWP
jgi:Ser/Thr protein kinase RdoA (MazF antagonist)